MTQASESRNQPSTPRTDAAVFKIADAMVERLRPDREVVDAYLARCLERELTEYRSRAELAEIAQVEASTRSETAPINAAQPGEDVRSQKSGDISAIQAAAAPEVILSSNAIVAATVIASDVFGRRWGDAETVAKELLRLRDCDGGHIRANRQGVTK